jgi:hypothetical protein
MFFELRTAGVRCTGRNRPQSSPRRRARRTRDERDDLSQSIDATIGQERTFANLCVAFAILALSIACVDCTASWRAAPRRTNDWDPMVLGGTEANRPMVLREVLALATPGIGL